MSHVPRSTPVNIIMFNMSRYADWRRGVNRNYHILHTLLADERVGKVIAVDFLPFTWRRAAKYLIADQLAGDARGDIVYGDLTSRCWQVSSKLYVYNTIDSMLRPGRITSELRRIVQDLHMEERLVVWSYDPLYTGYFGAFPDARYVFDAVDNWAAHSSYAARRGALLENYRTIAERSDLIFTVSDELRALFAPHQRTYWIPNAVDPGHFASSGPVSPRVADMPAPVIGFLGILQDRIDVDIIERVARDHAQASVVLAGPVWKGFPRARLEAIPNIRFIGAVPYREIPAVYRGFTVGIIPYLRNEFIRSTNSMKFYEYLAAGLPVVSTTCPGIDEFGDAIYRADDPAAFSAAVSRALAEQSPQRAEQGRALLAGKTWRDRTAAMLDLIYQQF